MRTDRHRSGRAFFRAPAALALGAHRCAGGPHPLPADRHDRLPLRPQEGVNLLRSYLAEASSIDLLEVVFKAVIEQGGVAAAKQLVLDELRRNPTLLGLDKLLEARLMDAPAEIWEELSMVKNLVHGYTQKVARYQCSHCGFKARQFYWQCPGCSRWETYPPRRTEELNVMN